MLADVATSALVALITDPFMRGVIITHSLIVTPALRFWEPQIPVNHHQPLTNLKTNKQTECNKERANTYAKINQNMSKMRKTRRLKPCIYVGPENPETSSDFFYLNEFYMTNCDNVTPTITVWVVDVDDSEGDCCALIHTLMNWNLHSTFHCSWLLNLFVLFCRQRQTHGTHSWS